MGLLMVKLCWAHIGLKNFPLEKIFMSFDCIVPHGAHDKFVSELTLFLEKW